MRARLREILRRQAFTLTLTALMVAKILGFEGELAAGMVLIGSVVGGMASALNCLKNTN